MPALLSSCVRELHPKQVVYCFNAYPGMGKTHWFTQRILTHLERHLNGEGLLPSEPEVLVYCAPTSAVLSAVYADVWEQVGERLYAAYPDSYQRNRYLNRLLSSDGSGEETITHRTAARLGLPHDEKLLRKADKATTLPGGVLLITHAALKLLPKSGKPAFRTEVLFDETTSSLTTLDVRLTDKQLRQLFTCTQVASVEAERPPLADADFEGRRPPVEPTSHLKLTPRYLADWKVFLSVPLSLEERKALKTHYPAVHEANQTLAARFAEKDTPPKEADLSGKSKLGQAFFLLRKHYTKPAFSRCKVKQGAHSTRASLLEALTQASSGSNDLYVVSNSTDSKEHKFTLILRLVPSSLFKNFHRVIIASAFLDRLQLHASLAADEKIALHQLTQVFTKERRKAWAAAQSRLTIVPLIERTRPVSRHMLERPIVQTAVLAQLQEEFKSFSLPPRDLVVLRRWINQGCKVDSAPLSLQTKARSLVNRLANLAIEGDRLAQEGLPRPLYSNAMRYWLERGHEVVNEAMTPKTSGPRKVPYVTTNGYAPILVTNKSASDSGALVLQGFPVQLRQADKKRPVAVRRPTAVSQMYEMLSTYQHGRNDLQDRSIMLYLAAINPTPELARAAKTLLPEADLDYDYSLSTCAQAAARMAVRNFKSTQQCVLIVVDSFVARGVAELFENRPTVLPPVFDVSKEEHDYVDLNVKTLWPDRVKPTKSAQRMNSALSLVEQTVTTAGRSTFDKKVYESAVTNLALMLTAKLHTAQVQLTAYQKRNHPKVETLRLRKSQLLNQLEVARGRLTPEQLRRVNRKNALAYMAELRKQDKSTQL